MSTPIPGPRRAGARSGQAEALLEGFEDAPLGVKIEMLSDLDRRLRESLDRPEDS